MTDEQVPNEILIKAVESLCAGDDLSASDAEAVLLEIMEGRVSEVLTAGFLIALRAKGETASELAGLAAAMRSLATPVRPTRGDLVDTAGTGGGRRTFNVSTTAALIAAGAGIGIAKHGNRSATGLSGSADLLEALGIPIDRSPEQIASDVDSIGFGFMFAPAHHAATKHVVPVRKALGTRTAFNLLGPLTNPAGADRQVVGVSDPSTVDVVAGALAELGAVRALVLSSHDGLDEISTSAPTGVVEVREGKITHWTLDPQDYGIAVANPDDVAGGGPADNARITRAILSGELGPTRDLAVVNAAAAILAAGDSQDFAACVRTAEQAIDSGAAQAVVDQLASV
ncbi:MAG: anthranilate phosphoribosyltransferase [Actinobacteria bacterium]|uniref:anthranilate phosphoribosyltransferase n=1 Tax=freshwater metagenome TaxID=449393 RepID=A0A6J7CQ35_9ZZZZ|nr:anthranilate phosphoribosyltransferase [Actinomycetota bacterium]